MYSIHNSDQNSYDPATVGEGHQHNSQNAHYDTCSESRL